jgi:o-succinylbenzoate---CoA ligase
VNLSVRSAVQEAPHQTALVTPAGCWTWTELAERVLAAAGRLHARSLPAHAPWALTAHPEVHVIVNVLAAWELGRAVLPLHPGLPAAARGEILRALEAVDLDALGESSARPRPLPAAAPDDERPLAVVRTSGSTGEAKSVQLSRAAFCASARASAARLGWQLGDRWLIALPFAHVGGLSILTRCLYSRKTMVLALLPGPGEFVALCDRLGVTHVSVVPAMLDRILAGRGGALDSRSLRVMLTGGGAAREGLVDEARDRGLPVVPTYGLTEACSQVATQTPGTRQEVGAGRPLPGVEVRSRDGRLEIHSPARMTGYLPAGRWASPFTQDGWLRTDDLGHVDDRGFVHVTGRADDAITTGGVTVQPREIERALERLPSVREALVFGVEDPTWGEVVAALIAPAQGAGAHDVRRDVSRLSASTRPRLTALVAELPRTALGKLDRGAARAHAHGLGPP